MVTEIQHMTQFFTTASRQFSCMFPASTDLFKILNKYPVFCEFYYKNDRAMNTTFTEIPRFSAEQELIHVKHSTFEPPHDKTNIMTECPAKTQISLGICPAWSVFAVWRTQAFFMVRCMLSRKLRTQAFFMRTAKTQIRLGGSESSLGTHAILLALSWGGPLWDDNVTAFLWKCSFI